MTKPIEAYKILLVDEAWRRPDMELSSPIQPTIWKPLKWHNAYRAPNRHSDVGVYSLETLTGARAYMLDRGYTLSAGFVIAKMEIAGTIMKFAKTRGGFGGFVQAGYLSYRARVVGIESIAARDRRKVEKSNLAHLLGA
jgi:hypothetical protein